MILEILFKLLMVPVILSALAIASARRLGRGSPGGRRGRWGVAVGLGLGYLAGHVGILGWPNFPPVESKECVAWLALMATVLGVVESAVDLPRWSRWTIRGLFVALSLGLVLRSKVENGWTAIESAAWFGGLELVLLASWWNLEEQAERLTGPGWVVPLGLVSVGWAVVQTLGGGASTGQLDGVLASTFLGALLSMGLRPGPALSRGGPPVALTVLAGLGLTGYFYAEVPAVSAILLTLAPWAPWVDRIGFIRRRSYWTRASVRFLVVLLIVGVAAFAAQSGASTPAEDAAGL
jgi:hypothetical protein